MKYLVSSNFLEEDYETSEEAKSPQEAAGKHIGKLPFEDGLDYPDDFWNIIVPIAEGEYDNLKLDLDDSRENCYIWSKGCSLTWPITLKISQK